MRTWTAIFVSSIVFASIPSGSEGARPELSAGFQLGYTGGPGGLASLTLGDFARGFPLRARFALGYTAVDPGSPAEARRIFINNATNGTPEESGSVWDVRFDLSYSFNTAALNDLRLYGGPRYARFNGNFKFIGGNEDFDVTSRGWGLGAGVEGRFDMGLRSDLVLGAGFDHYPAGTLEGHDTAYGPDGETVNGREDLAYSDADAAINQPGFEWRLLVGFDYHFGR